MKLVEMGCAYGNVKVSDASGRVKVIVVIMEVNNRCGVGITGQ